MALFISSWQVRWGVDEQAVVARIVELRRARASCRSIATILDTEGHRPRRAASWSAMAVRAVVQRELGEHAVAVATG